MSPFDSYFDILRLVMLKVVSSAYTHLKYLALSVAKQSLSVGTYFVRVLSSIVCRVIVSCYLLMNFQQEHLLILDFSQLTVCLSYLIVLVRPIC